MVLGEMGFVAHSDASPLRISIPCFNAGRITFRDSFTPLGLPGKFIIKDLFLIPATALDSIALGVILRLSSHNFRYSWHILFYDIQSGFWS